MPVAESTSDETFCPPGTDHKFRYTEVHFRFFGDFFPFFVCFSVAETNETHNTREETTEKSEMHLGVLELVISARRIKSLIGNGFHPRQGRPGVSL